MEELKLYDAEYRLLEIVWELEPLTSTELYKACLPGKSPPPTRCFGSFVNVEF